MVIPLGKLINMIAELILAISSSSSPLLYFIPSLSFLLLRSSVFVVSSSLLCLPRLLLMFVLSSSVSFSVSYSSAQLLYSTIQVA